MLLDGPFDIGAHAGKSNGRGGASSGGDAGGGTAGGGDDGGGDTGGAGSGGGDDGGGSTGGASASGGDDGGGDTGGADAGGGATGDTGSKDKSSSRGRGTGSTKSTSDGDDSGSGSGSDDDGSDDGGTSDGDSAGTGGDDGGSDSGSTGGDDGSDGDDGGSDSGSADGDDGGSTGGTSGTGTAGGDSETGDVAPGSANAAAASRKDSIGIDRDGGRESVAGELVVLDDRPGVLDGARAMGFRVKDQHRFEGLGLTVSRLALPRGMSLSLALAQLHEAFPGILVDVNGVYRAASVGTSLDATHPAQTMGWSQAPANCGSGVAIGLIDGGVDLAPLIGKRIHLRSFVGEGASGVSRDHGTTVASILVGAPGGRLPGLVPGAELFSAEVFSADRDGTPVTTALRIAAALDWLMSEGVRIANLSLTGEDNLLLEAAIRRAAAKRAVLIAAAGNGGPDAPAAYPAAYDGVIAVTAVDASLLPLAEANRGGYVDFAAPGDGIPSPESESGTVSGTSFAAPFVTALVAARAGAGVAVEGQEAAVRLLASGALDLGEPGRDDVFGWGFVQGQGACAVRSASAPFPPSAE